MGSALRFKSTTVPRQPGELARLKVVQGPDFGAMYVLCGPQATIGRGDENDLIIADLRSSRRHAEFLFQGGAWGVRDLGSANGIFVNGTAGLASPLKSADTVTVGETTLEFMVSAESGTAMLTAPGRAPNEYRQIRTSNTQLNLAYKERVSSVRQPSAKSGALRAAPATGAAAKKLNPVILLVAVLGVGALFMFDPDGKPKTGGKKPNAVDETVRDLASYMPDQQAMATMNRSADAFYRAGFREYRSGNYLRAKLQFENALQVMPTHPLASIYLKNCDLQIDATVKKHLEFGKKDFDAGKLKSAKAHFEAIQRLLFRNQSGATYVEATEQLEKVTKEMKEGGA